MATRKTPSSKVQRRLQRTRPRRGVADDLARFGYGAEDFLSGLTGLAGSKAIEEGRAEEGDWMGGGRQLHFWLPRLVQMLQEGRVGDAKEVWREYREAAPGVTAEDVGEAAGLFPGTALKLLGGAIGLGAAGYGLSRAAKARRASTTSQLGRISPPVPTPTAPARLRKAQMKPAQGAADEEVLKRRRFESDYEEALRDRGFYEKRKKLTGRYTVQDDVPAGAGEILESPVEYSRRTHKPSAYKAFSRKDLEEAQLLDTERRAEQLRSVQDVRYGKGGEILGQQGRIRGAKPLTEAQVEKLLASPNRSTPEGARDAALMELMFRVGMRVHDVADLRLVDDIRIDQLAPELQKLFKTYLGGRKSGPLFARSTDEGTALTKEALRKIVKRHGGDVDATPHSLRKAFAIKALHKGHNPSAIQKALGHGTLDVTAEYTRAAGWNPMRDIRAPGGKRLKDVDPVEDIMSPQWEVADVPGVEPEMFNLPPKWAGQTPDQLFRRPTTWNPYTRRLTAGSETTSAMDLTRKSRRGKKMPTSGGRGYEALLAQLEEMPGTAGLQAAFKNLKEKQDALAQFKSLQGSWGKLGLIPGTRAKDVSRGADIVETGAVEVAPDLKALAPKVIKRGVRPGGLPPPTTTAQTKALLKTPAGKQAKEEYDTAVKAYIEARDSYYTSAFAKHPVPGKPGQLQGVKLRTPAPRGGTWQPVGRRGTKERSDLFDRFVKETKQLPGLDEEYRAVLLDYEKARQAGKSSQFLRGKQQAIVRFEKAFKQTVDDVAQKLDDIGQTPEEYVKAKRLTLGVSEAQFKKLTYDQQIRAIANIEHQQQRIKTAKTTADVRRRQLKEKALIEGSADQPTGTLRRKP
jgi:integrase